MFGWRRHIARSSSPRTISIFLAADASAQAKFGTPKLRRPPEMFMETVSRDRESPSACRMLGGSMIRSAARNQKFPSVREYLTPGIGLSR